MDWVKGHHPKNKQQLLEGGRDREGREGGRERGRERGVRETTEPKVF
jgi:hypothetical protein